MASSLVLKRATASTLFSRLLTPIRSVSVAPSVSRSFNTNAQMSNYDDGSDDRSVDVELRSDRSVSRRRRETAPSIFSDVFDPFSPTRSLSQVLNLMDQFTENPFLAASQGMGSVTRRAWDVKEDNDALYLRMDMPGVGKDNVKVTIEQDTLIIKGEGEIESEDENGARKYSSRIDLPPKLYKIDDIKAEMKNGVLKVVVPKVKEEERKDVFQVNVE